MKKTRSKKSRDTVPLTYRILKIWKANFLPVYNVFYLSHQCQMCVINFCLLDSKFKFSVKKFSLSTFSFDFIWCTDPDRPDPNRLDPDRHAMVVDPDPDPAKEYWSDTIRIRCRIHNTAPIPLLQLSRTVRWSFSDPLAFGLKIEACKWQYGKNSHFPSCGTRTMRPSTSGQPARGL